MTAHEMKDSSIEWIGLIPKEWNVKPIYTVFENIRNKNIDGAETKSLRFSYGKIIPKENFDISENYVEKTIRSYTKVRPGDIVINGLNLNYDFITKRVAIVEDQGVITSAYLTMRAKDKLFSKFFSYLFKSYDDCRAFHGMGEGVRKILNFSELKKHFVVFPSVREQEKIAHFLDSKCAEIDALTADIEKQIETLQEYKKSVITEAVTKGLDPNVEMKDSGVEWIRHFPSSWAITRIKYVATLSSGATPNRSKPEYWNGNIPWVKTGELKDSYITEIDERISELALKNTSLKIYPKDTLLMAMYGQGKTRGMTGCLTQSSTINQACLAFTNLTDVNRDYFWLVLRAIYDPIRSIAIGSGQPNLNSDLVSNFHIPLPCISEQVQIVQFLQKKLLEVEELVNCKKTQIETLTNYKQSLIYEYVTGKKTVPNA